MSTADYITRGIQTLTTNLGLTKLTQNLFDPTVDAVNSNAAILDAAGNENHFRTVDKKEETR